MAEKHFADGAAVDVFGWPTVATFPLSAAGFTAPVTASARCMVLGSGVWLSTQTFSGTSNSTTFELTTLPPEFRPSADRIISCRFVTDHGKTDVVGSLLIRANGVISVYAGPPGTSFATNGRKELPACEAIYLK